jgi:hypothetical protein
MMTTAWETSTDIKQSEGSLENPELEALREKINNEEYLHEAIQRIALILSNELLDIPQGGWNYERQRKRRR